MQVIDTYQIIMLVLSLLTINLVIVLYSKCINVLLLIYGYARF